MTEIKYTGTSNFRVLRAEDFSRLGVEGISETTWARGEGLQLSDDAADAVLAHLGDEFAEVVNTAPASPAIEIPHQVSVESHLADPDLNSNWAG